MTLTVASIVLFTTLVLGSICKSTNLRTKNNIPLQNLIIGVISGFICYFAGVENNLMEAIILCVMSAFSAGGVYDLSKTVRKDK